MPRTNTNSQPGNRRAAIYARVSDKSQAEDDKTSIGEQTSDMEAYCAERGLTITARYQEVGRGWSKSRPEFQRMLADAASGRFDVIVCWKSDRLSRGMYPAAALMEVVEAHGIGLEAVMDAIDMKTFGLMAAIGKIELDNFRERASMGKRGTAKQGRIPVSNVPDGYRIGEDRTPEIDEERASVIRRIFRHYVEDGMGAPAIVAALTDDGVPTSRPGASWHATQVNRILRDEAYKGTWWYGKARHTATDTGTRVHAQPRDAWIGVPFPPLVDEETWERAKTLRERRLTRSPRNTKTFHLLQHLVHCSECGMLMGPRAVRSQSTKRRGKTYTYRLKTPRRYYRCYGMGAPYRLRCREHPFIRAERLEDLVWGEVRRVLQDPDLIAAGLAALDPDEDTGAEDAARTERELAGVQAEEDRAIRLYVSGKISEQQLDHQRRFIGERLERLRARLDEHRARTSAQAGRRVAVEQVVEWARAAGGGLDGLSDPERREVLDLLLEEATIDGENNVTLTLAIPADEEFVSIAKPERTSMAITPTDTLRYETEGRKAIITLTRPEAMNALNREILNAIGEAIHEYEADDNLLVAIITGDGGRAFSAGADLKEMTQRDQAEGVDDTDMGPGFNGFDDLDACRKPLIAAVDGYCLAGGLEVTIYCDMVVATEQSRFGLPEPRRSLLAGPGLHNLARIIPYREAMMIQLTGGHMSSERAYDIGLIQRRVPDREAMWAAAHELADEILECAPLAVQAIKRIVKTGRQLPVEYSEKLAEPIADFIATTEDRLEGPKAFAEKRAPNWKMR